MVLQEAGLRPLQHSLHTLFLQVRNLDRIIHSFEFESAYSRASAEQQQEVKQYIDSHNQKAIERWMISVNMINADIACLSITELRKLGRSKNIPGYQYLPKASLLSALKQQELKDDRPDHCIAPGNANDNIASWCPAGAIS